MSRLERQKYPGLERLQTALYETDTQTRLRLAGVRTVLIASRDGLMIDAVVCWGEAPDVDDLAAHAATVLHFAGSRSDGTLRTRVNVVFVEYDDGTLAMEPTGEAAILVFLTEPMADFTRIRSELHRLATRHTAAADDTFATPSQDGNGVEPAPKAPDAAKIADAPLRALNWLQDEPVVSSGNGQAVLASEEAGRNENGADLPVEIRADRPEPVGAPAHEGPMPQSPGRDRRIILRDVGFAVAGQSATATVGLVLDGRPAIGRAVARTGADMELRLPAEAAVRAITEFLPPGHGIVLEHVRSISSETEPAVWAKVLLLTPEGEQALLGIAGVTDDAPGAVVRAVLSAVNRRIALLLDRA